MKRKIQGRRTRKQSSFPKPFLSLNPCKSGRNRGEEGKAISFCGDWRKLGNLDAKEKNGRGRMKERGATTRKVWHRDGVGGTFHSAKETQLGERRTENYNEGEERG